MKKGHLQTYTVTIFWVAALTALTCCTSADSAPEPPPEKPIFDRLDILTARVIALSTLTEKQKAARELLQAGPAGLSRLEKICSGSKPGARLAAAQALIDQKPQTARKVLLEALDDNRIIRTGPETKSFVAWEAVKILRQHEGKNFGFVMKDGDKRKKAVKAWKKLAHKNIGSTR